MAERIIRTIGVLTSGGDAPGMNATIRAVVRTALGKGVKVRGIRKGYKGLLNEVIIDLDAGDVSEVFAGGKGSSSGLLLFPGPLLVRHPGGRIAGSDTGGYRL